MTDSPHIKNPFNNATYAAEYYQPTRDNVCHSLLLLGADGEPDRALEFPLATDTFNHLKNGEKIIVEFKQIQADGSQDFAVHQLT